MSFTPEEIEQLQRIAEARAHGDDIEVLPDGTWGRRLDAAKIEARSVPVDEMINTLWLDTVRSKKITAGSITSRHYSDGGPT